MDICRVDYNQKNIIDSLRKAGRSVQPIHTIGRGCPDILVGYQGKNYLFEIKNHEKPKSHKKLTPMEETWHTLWRGSVSIIETVEEALKITELGE